MIKTASETRADVLIISEQNVNKQYKSISGTAIYHWTSSTDNICAIATIYCEPEVSGRGEGFAWVKIKNKFIYSYYWSPSNTTADYQRYLGTLYNTVKTNGGETVIAGDFNAHSPEWGGTKEDIRGELLSKLVISLNMRT